MDTVDDEPVAMESDEYIRTHTIYVTTNEDEDDDSEATEIDEAGTEVSDAVVEEKRRSPRLQNSSVRSSKESSYAETSRPETRTSKRKKIKRTRKFCWPKGYSRRRKKSKSSAQNKYKPNETLQFMEETPDGWQCKVCEAVYDKRESLRVHVIRRHMNTLSQNQITRIAINERIKTCSDLLQTADNLAKASASDHVVEKDDGFACAICEQFYEYKESLMKHIRRNHLQEDSVDSGARDEDNEALTDDVEAEETNELELERALSASKYKDYIKKVDYGLACGLCGREYPRMDPLRRHLSLHFDSEDPMSFVSRRRSMKEREEIMKYRVDTDTGCQCKVCGSEYKNWNTLRIHILRYHVNKVETEEPAPTALDKAVSASKYKDYIKKVDDGLACGLCGREYPRMDPLRRHLTSHFEASEPALFVSTRRTMKEREEILSYKVDTDSGFRCKACDAEFKGWPAIRAHILRRHIKTSLDKLTLPRVKVTKDRNAEEVKEQNMELRLFPPARFMKEREGHEGSYVCTICSGVNVGQGCMLSHLQGHLKGGKASDDQVVENTVNVDGGVQCTICFQVFDDNVRLNYHVKWHLSARQYAVRVRCELCSIVISKLKLDRHMKLKHSDLSSSDKLCRTCDQTVSAKDWKAHKADHKLKGEHASEKRTFLCEHCATCLSSRKSLLRHLRTHMFPRTFTKCTICDREIVSSNMKRHLRMHERMRQGSDKKICEYCAKEYRTIKSLKKHIDAHHSGKSNDCTVTVRVRKYACEQCPKVYNSMTSLRYHLNWHAGIKPYVCDVCSKGFKCNSSLKAHKIVHSENKPFKCRYCDKAFRLKPVRYRHECTHTGERPYSCEDCGKQFIQQHVFARHRCRTRKISSDSDCADLAYEPESPHTAVTEPPPLILNPPDYHHSGYEVPQPVFRPVNYAALDMSYRTDPSMALSRSVYPQHYDQSLAFAPQMEPHCSGHPIPFPMQPQPPATHIIPSTFQAVQNTLPNTVDTSQTFDTPCVETTADRNDKRVTVERLDPCLYRPRNPGPINRLGYKLDEVESTSTVQRNAPTTGQDAFQEFLRKRAYGEVDTTVHNTGIPMVIRTREMTKAEKMIVKLPHSPSKNPGQKQPSETNIKLIRENNDVLDEMAEDNEEQNVCADEERKGLEEMELDGETGTVEEEDVMELDETAEQEDEDVDDESDGKISEEEDEDDVNSDMEDAGSVGNSHDDQLDVVAADHDAVNEPGQKTILQCPVCNETFRTKSGLRGHESKHPELGRRSHSCETCQKLFPSKSRLEEHLRVHSGEKPHPCQFCGRGFRTLSAMKTHARIHTGEKPYQCDICQADFRFRSNYRRHVEMHNEASVSVCDVCGKEFKVRERLYRHKLTHTDQKDHTCLVCDAKFGNPAALKRHMVSHSELRPYICSVCGNRFKVLFHLRRHELTHSERQPTQRIACTVSGCATTFSCKDGLRSHFKRVHEHREKPLKACRYCPKTFSDSTSLTRHEGRHFGSFRFPCPMCEKGFDKRKELERHVNIHVNGRAKRSWSKSKRTDKALVAADDSPLVTEPLNLTRS